MKQAMTISFRWFFVLALPCIVFGTPTGVSAATGINDQISFQGKVVNTNGTNVANGNYDFVFRIYTVSSGGVAAWTETWNSGTAQVTVTDGIFQVNLGTHTDLPGSIDFNTDNIYLGIEFNGDGEMSPRVHFTAAPYAFNAMRVGGLTVTDTTGTLTVPNGETISFGGSFTTSASNDVTLTTSGATNVTLPTTGTLATLAGNEVFTNKSIGSTGLTFSGATTDLTTASGEDLTLTAAGAGVIVLSDSVTSGALTISGATTDITTASGESLVLLANGAGTIDLQDATTADSLTLDSGGLTLQNGETIGNGTDDIIAFGGAGGADNTDLFLDLDGTSPLLYSNTDVRVSVDDFLNVQVSGVTGAAAGDIWYDSAANKFKINENGTTKILCNTTDLGCASGGSLTVRESDGSPSVSSTTTLEFGPASTSSEEFIVTDQTGGVARVVAGTMIGKLNEAETVTAGWTFNTAATTFTTAINANGGITTTTTDQNLAFSANGGGDFVFSVDSGTFVSLTGGADGTSALTVAAGDVTLSDGDLIVSGGDANFTLDAGDTLNIAKTGANAGDVANITASSVNAIDGLQLALTSTADTGADNVTGIDLAWTESTDADVWTAINLPNTTSTNSTTQGLVIGTGYDLGISVASGGVTIAAGALAVNSDSITSDGTLVINASGTVDVDDILNANSITSDAGVSIAAGNSYTGAGAVTVASGGTSALTFDATNGNVTLATDDDLIPTLGAGDADLGASGTRWDNIFGSVGNFTSITINGTSDPYVDEAGDTMTGALAIDPTTTGTFLDFVLETQWTSGDLINADWGSSVTQTAALTGINLDFSNLTSVAGSTTYGILINDLAAQTSSTEYAFYQEGTGWDFGLYVEDAAHFNTTVNVLGTFDARGDVSDSTGNLTLNDAVDVANLLTASGGITLASSQTFTASSLSYMDLGAVTHGTTAVQGLRLPQAASASPSSPLSGEGYLAWDAAGNQLIYYTGSAWSPVSGSASDLQTTYAADADGGNATISLTTADDSLVITNPTSSGTDSAFVLQVTQQNTTAAVTILDLVQSSNAANAVNLTANSIDTETGLAITANALTTGTALSLASSSTAITSASLLTATFSGAPAASWTGNLALFEATAADVDIDGSALKVGLTGAAAGDGIALNVTTAQTGTSALALRVSDDGTYTDSTPFAITATGAVGIGTSAPASMFELYGAGTADIVSTLTAPDATYDPLIKFRTESTPAVQFTLGVDNSDGDKFKIYSGDGIGTGEEFVIDSNGVTTISNLNLGAISFDENAGAVTWVDMSVSAAAPVDTIESYTAAIDGNDMFTIYAESDGAGSIQDKRVIIGTSGAGSTAPALLALDVKSTTGDPTGFEGAMYYNTNDNVFRCYQNSGWTDCISSGGSSDLQTTYGNDADGSNATISLTTADDSLIFTNPTSAGTDSAYLLFLNQQNTTGVVSALDITQASNASNAVNLTANSIDTETGLAISATGLTTGYAQTIGVNGATTLTTGGALRITGPTGAAAQAAGSLLLISTAGAVTGTDGSGNSLQVSSGTLTGTVASITGTGVMTTTGDLLTLTANSATTPTGLLTVNANGLTTGNAVNIASSSTAITSASLLTATFSGAPAASWTGDLVKFEATSADVDVDGNALKVGLTGAAAGSGTALNVTTAQTGTGALALRVNDDGTYTDSTPFIVNAAGFVLVGTTTAVNQLTVVSAEAADPGFMASSCDGCTTSLVLMNNIATVNSKVGLDLQFSAGTYAEIFAIRESGVDGSIGFSTNLGGSVQERMRLEYTGDLGLGDQTPDAKLDIDFDQTSGSLYAASAPASVTLAGALTGLSLNLSTNVTATGFSVTGGAITLPAVTNTGASTYNYQGSTVTGSALTANGASTIVNFNGVAVTNSNITQSNGTITANGLSVTTGSITTGGTQRGLNVTATGVGAGTLNGVNISSITGAGGTETAIEIGAGWDTGINLNANILTNIGNSGTDFVASTGALTLAGVLTANGGITLASSQTFTASSLSYMDLGSITHGTTAVQGLRLPQAASASPSNPTSGEGYLAWDSSGNQVIYYNGSAWSTFAGGSGYSTIKDESTGLTQRTTLAFLGAGVTCADNVTQTECTISGGTAPSDTLQNAYDAGSAGDQVVTLDGTQDSIVFRNPSSSGSDSAFTFKVEQLNTGIANDALYIDNRGTGNGLRIDDASGDTTPFIVDANGVVGIQTASVDTTSNSKLALQVGSSDNRSDVSVFGDVKAEGYDIQRSLTGIIDIFVYDTSRDTDGGEWRDSRYTLQNSWATETKDDGVGDPCDIANDDRCGSSAFPRKAILVTTASALYIFDASDNSMWMKFTQAGTYALGADTNNNPSGVGAQNGVVVVGTNGSSATGMYAFDFKQDVMYRYNSTNRVQADTTIGIRNTATSYATNAETNFAILDSVVNDVSIALQTGSNEGAAGTLVAPIDSQAGPVRGVTLIAAATDTGVSVVHMARREVFSYSDATGNDYNQVVVTSRGRMYATNEALAQLEEWRNIDRDLASETNGTPDRVYDETIGKSPITLGTVPTMSTSPGALGVIERASGAREAAAAGQIDTGDIVYVGTNQGLAEIHTSGGALVAASWSKVTTTTVATPYMNGAVRSAFLFDDTVGSTTATSAVGPTANVLDTAGGTSPTFGGSGVRGNSVNFGNNSYLCSDANTDGTCDADTDYNVAATSFSINLWFRHGTTAALDTLFERCYTPATPTAAACVWGGMTSTGAIAFGIDDDATWTLGTSMDDLVTSPALYNDDLWHHAVFTNTDTDICLYIDGAQAGCDTTLGATATLDASQVVTIGGTCSGANCTTGTNFWDGSIDDLTWNASAGTTAGGLTAQSVNRLYLDGRAHLIRPAATVTNATTATSTTIGDSGESYVPGSFVGLVVELTGDTGSGQTRTIIANDSTTFTVYPAFTVTPDTTTDYRVSPAKLYGSTNNVTAIGIDAPVSLNRVRKMYVGTSDGSDGGAISVFTNAGAGSIKTEVIHSDAGYEDDDLGSSWSGTDADDITAIGSYSDTVTLGTGSFFRTQRKDIALKQLQTDMIGSFEDIRHQLVASGLFGATQDVLGLGQGADLAENYYSSDLLEAGEIVSLDTTREAGIQRSSSAYQRDVIGVVATKPAIVMGDRSKDAYPIALVGRVPVRVTNENGPIYAGDRIATASRPGYGMFANQAGRVVGVALADAGDWVACEGEDPLTETPKLCSTVLVFVNLTDYYGQPVELAMAKRAKSVGLAISSAGEGTETGLAGEDSVIRLSTTTPTREEQIMAFLKEVRDEKAKQDAAPSEVFTDRVAASTEIITPKLVVEEIFAKSIKADSIEGLAIYTNRIASLEAKYAGLSSETESAGDVEVSMEKAWLNLEQFSVGSLAVALDASILGKLSVAGALTVADAAQFEGETTFARLATFVSETLFRGPVAFEKVPTFSADTAGFATIPEGARRVRVAFDTAYAEQPIVSVTLTRDMSPILEGADESLRADIEIVEAEYTSEIFAEDVRFIVTEKDPTGFTILLAKEAPADLSFSWVAIAVKGAKTTTSSQAGEPLTSPSPTSDQVITPPETDPFVEPTVSPTETDPAPSDILAAPPSES